MKIISKFTDFYEYDCYRYGAPDERIRWIRDRQVTRYDLPIYDNVIRKLVDKLFLCNMAQSQKLYTGKYGDGFALYISEELVGIYPYLYYIPVVYYNKPAYYDNRWRDTAHFSVEDSLKCLTVPGYYKECMKEYGLNYKKYLIPEQILKAGKTIKDFHNGGRDIANDPFIVENREIFKYIESPVFIIDYDSPTHIKYSDSQIHLTKDCNLMEDTFILLAYPSICGERDIYNDIEDYFWSIKQEPMSEPDNKTKILAHGFDYKTSFRKM